MTKKELNVCRYTLGPASEIRIPKLPTPILPGQKHPETPEPVIYLKKQTERHFGALKKPLSEAKKPLSDSQKATFKNVISTKKTKKPFL
jgi:hypothetical protein